jgi:hypothetical protein
MAINENYLSFIEICKRDGVYIDKKINFKLKISKGKIFSLGRNGAWELHFNPVSMPNKRRFLKFR